MTLLLQLLVLLAEPLPQLDAGDLQARARELMRDQQFIEAADVYLALASASLEHRREAFAGAHTALDVAYTNTQFHEYLCHATKLAEERAHDPSLQDDSERAFWSAAAEDDRRRLVAAGSPETLCNTNQVTPRRSPRPSAARSPTPKPPTRPAPANPPPTKRPLPPARIGTGATLLAAGAGLVAGMALSLRGRDRANQTIADLDAAILAEDRSPTPAERALVDAEDARYQRFTHAAITTGVLAAASLAGGLALLMAPVRPLPWAGPRGVGITLTVSF